MSELLSRIARIRRDLRELGYASALVGGFAVGLHVRPRMTQDVDLAVAIESDRDAERIALSLRERGYRITHLVEHTARHRLSTVRLCLPGSAATEPEADLLFASSGIEPQIVEDAQLMPCGEAGEVPVARIGHLIAMKVLAHAEGREQDALDVRALLGVACEEEIQRARQAVALIEERGFHRDKDLRAELEVFVGRQSSP